MLTGEAKENKEQEKPPIKAVIFDLDGVLIDSEPLWSEGRKQVLSQYGAVYLPEDKKVTLGRDYRTGVAYIIERYNLPLTVDEYADAEKQILDKLYEEQLKLMPGVCELLDKLDQVQIPKAIATSSSRRRLNLVMKLVELKNFDATVCGDEVRNGKPAPDIFLKAARRLGVEPNVCVVLEDSPFGVVAARAAGMKSVAVYDPRFSSEEDFRGQSKPDFLLDSLDKLDFQKLHVQVK